MRPTSLLFEFIVILHSYTNDYFEKQNNQLSVRNTEVQCLEQSAKSINNSFKVNIIHHIRKQNVTVGWTCYLSNLYSL